MGVDLSTRSLNKWMSRQWITFRYSVDSYVLEQMLFMLKTVIKVLKSTNQTEFRLHRPLPYGDP